MALIFQNPQGTLSWVFCFYVQQLICKLVHPHSAGQPALHILDPSGIDRLSQDEATQLGFPSFKLTTEADRWYWDSHTYEGLRQFHQAKGFDPYSQDVARHVGHPLWQLSSQRDAPFAYGMYTIGNLRPY